MILFPPWRPFLSSALLSKPSLTSDRAIESRVRIASSLRVSNLFFARVEIPSVRGVSSYRVERNPVCQERKCKSGLGVREGRAKPLRAPGRNQELRWNGGMKSIDARESLCMCLPFICVLDRVRASVRRCKCNSRRGLVVSSPGDISPLLRTKRFLSLSLPFFLFFSLSLSSSSPSVLQSGKTRRIFEPWGPTLPGLRSGVVYFFCPFSLFIYVPLLEAGFRRSRTNVASVLVFTRIIHNA